MLSDAARRSEYDAALGFLPPDAPALACPTPAAGAGPAEAELPAALTGADLRRLRESRGISLREIASASKIGMRYLEYIEADRFALLPAPVYLRGFLQEYARVVGLDQRRVADAYMSRIPAKPR